MNRSVTIRSIDYCSLDERKTMWLNVHKSTFRGSRLRREADSSAKAALVKPVWNARSPVDGLLDVFVLPLVESDSKRVESGPLLKFELLPDATLAELADLVFE